MLKSHFKVYKFDFDLYEKLPKYNSSEILPEEALNSDAILYFINLPLSANDFLWLEKFPKKNFLIILLFLGFGEWFVSDLIHFAGGSIGFFILCLGGYFYLKNDKPKFNEPNNLDGWINLCNEDLNFFEELEATNAVSYTHLTLPTSHNV